MRIRSRLLTKLMAFAAVVLIRTLFATCRLTEKMRPGTCAYRPTGERRFLFSVWHDQLIMTIFSDRPKQMAGLVSSHQDGSYLADAMQMVNIRPVRGSTNRGGDRALREMLDAARDWHIAITPDGPRGPRRKAKVGIVFLASKSGRPIVPAVHTCKRYWKIQGSWTDMMLPMPFSPILLIGGEPMYIPKDLDRGGLEHYAQLLEKEMERLEQVAERWRMGESIGDPPSHNAAAA
ncbi:MAG: lysophospholipid acyltransferase family protein [Planctomycetaceae bacterium]